MNSYDNLMYQTSPEDKQYKEFQAQHPRKSSRRKVWVIIAVVTIVIAVAVALGVVFALKKPAKSSSSPSSSGNSPTGPVDLNVTVTLPTSAPQNAVSLSSTLLSLSIEQDRWPEWVGVDSPNQYFLNLLSNVQQITGTPVSIRVGADSEDLTKYDPSVPVSHTVFPPLTSVYPYPEAQNLTVSDGFYKLVTRLPQNTVVTWGVPYKSANITSTYLNAKAIMRTFNSAAVQARNITLKYLEVGNEPDYYAHHGARNKSWNVERYINQWTIYATNVTQALGLTPGQEPSILGGSFANTSHTAYGFSPMTLLGDGLLSTGPGELIKTYSQHFYSGNFCKGNGGLMQDLMDKSDIRAHLDRFQPDIASVKAKGLDYIFGETNSYACHGAPNVSNAAGSALWLLDYGMYAAQLGVSQLYLHNGIGYKYNLIQPVELDRSILDGTPLDSPLPPHIQPAYYAMIIAAEAIGNSNNVVAVELNINAPRLAGYAFYENGALVRAILINSNAHLSTDGGPETRTSTLVHLGLSGAGLTTMTVKRLSIGYADDTGGITWGGQTYETADGLISGNANLQTLPISTGLYVASTEVVLLSFH